jgi:hypothetical protein
MHDWSKKSPEEVRSSHKQRQQLTIGNLNAKPLRGGHGLNSIGVAQCG